MKRWLGVGALLGAATSLAFSGMVSTGQPLVGALIFPVSLVMIVLLGLELVTGSFGLLPLARLEDGVDTRKIVANWSWVFVGNLIGSVIYGALLAIALTDMCRIAPTGVAAKIVAIAEMSDGSFWQASADVVVTLQACLETL